MNSLFKARFDYAFHLIVQRAHVRCIEAKRELGLDATDDCDRLRQLRFEGNTFVSAARLIGFRMQDIFDIDPDHFHHSTKVVIDVPLPAMTYSRAVSYMNIDRTLQLWFSNYEKCTNSVGISGVRSVELLDNLDRVVGFASVLSGTEIFWIEPIEPDELRIAMEYRDCLKTVTPTVDVKHHADDARIGNQPPVATLAERASRLVNLSSIQHHRDQLLT